MATTDYKSFSVLTQCEERLDRYCESGRLSDEVFGNLITDIAARKVHDLEGHPLWKESDAPASDGPEGDAVRLTGGFHSCLRDYLTEKVFNPDLKLSDSNAMKMYLRGVAENSILTKCFNIGTVQQTLPRILEASFAEAKTIIKDIHDQHTVEVQRARA